MLAQRSDKDLVPAQASRTSVDTCRRQVSGYDLQRTDVTLASQSEELRATNV